MNTTLDHDPETGCAPRLRAEPFLSGYDERARRRGVVRRIVPYWPFLGVPVFLTLFFLGTGAANGLVAAFWSFVLNGIISICFGGSLLLTYGLVTERFIRRTASTAAWLMLHAATVAASVALGSESSLAILRWLPGLDATVERRGLYSIGSLVMGTLWIVEYVHGTQRARARAIEMREERARRDALRAQLAALQARTDPHFLFNSLNTVASLIEEDPALAERVLEKLAHLFRYALDSGRRSAVPLGEELGAVRDYLGVEALRLGARLQHTVTVEPGVEELEVPPLVLQPLVENAVLHGVAPRESGGHVWVSAGRQNGALVLRVEDDGPGAGGTTHRGGAGTALATLSGRLELAFGGRATVTSGPRPGGGHAVDVRLPLDALGPGARAEGGA